MGFFALILVLRESGQAGGILPSSPTVQYTYEVTKNMLRVLVIHANDKKNQNTYVENLGVIVC